MDNRINPKICVVVPVYNVENYLKRCLDSIVNQTYSNMEIVLVDDGSTDNSGKICDEYSQKYSCITVLHKKNGGQSTARNMGVKHATAEYITFVGSDDYISEDYLKTLWNTLSQTGAVMSVGRICESSDKKSHLCTGKTELFDDEQMLKNILDPHISIPVSACACLYPKNILMQYPFPEGKIHEDILCHIVWQRHVKRLLFVINIYTLLSKGRGVQPVQS